MLHIKIGSPEFISAASLTKLSMWTIAALHLPSASSSSDAILFTDPYAEVNFSWMLTVGTFYIQIRRIGYYDIMRYGLKKNHVLRFLNIFTILIVLFGLACFSNRSTGDSLPRSSCFNVLVLAPKTFRSSQMSTCLCTFQKIINVYLNTYNSNYKPINNIPTARRHFELCCPPSQWHSLRPLEVYSKIQTQTLLPVVYCSVWCHLQGKGKAQIALLEALLAACPKSQQPSELSCGEIYTNETRLNKRNKRKIVISLNKCGNAQINMNGNITVSYMKVNRKDNA